MIQDFLWTWMPWFYNRSIEIIDLMKRGALAAHTEITVQKEWVFLKSSNVPLLSQVFLHIPNSSIRWRCETHPPRFVDPNFVQEMTLDLKHCSYLGFSVILPGHDPIDLTDWINEVKWCGYLEPSPSDIFTLWSCEKGVSYFHCMSEARVEIIDESGNVISKGLNGSMRTNSSTDDRSPQGES